MLRYQLFLSIGILFVACWVALLQNEEKILNSVYSPLPASAIEIFIRLLPLWLIVCLAFYAIASIGYGMMNFVDCPEAASEIERNVREAKIELRKKGVAL